jgi:hypothetical protein
MIFEFDSTAVRPIMVSDRSYQLRLRKEVRS